MDQKLKNEIKRIIQCREKIIDELFEIIGYESDEQLPTAVYINGQTGTGKTFILNELLKISGRKYVQLNCLECYTSKILFESILNKFHNHKLLQSENFAPFEKCDTLMEFIKLLKLFDSTDSYIICMDNAERIRDLDFNILPCLMRLRELTGLNISCIFTSQLPFEKYFIRSGLPEIHIIHCPQYNKTEITKILLHDFSNLRVALLNQLPKKEYNDKLSLNKRFEIINSLEEDFYENFLNVFLSVFYKACRDLQELKLISKDCFLIYLEPILNGELNMNDISKLWRYIAQPLRIALSQVYMRMEHSSYINEDCNAADEIIIKLDQTLDLPYYGKYLLIAAFLASHNSAKTDKRLFVKNHGKKRKRLQTVNSNAKLTEKMSTTLGPKSFSVDRLVAIFYAILEEKVGLSCNLLAQISTLVNLKLLTCISGENNIMEGSAKLQCTVSLDFIVFIGKSVGFNVRQYLCDFM